MNAIAATTHEGSAGPSNSAPGMKLLVVQLLNNRTGSPIALATFLSALSTLTSFDRGVAILTDTRYGPLTESNGDVIEIPYKVHVGLAGKALAFARVQLRLFVAAFSNSDRRTVVLVNTLLPVAAAVGARLRGASVVFFVHEVSLSPALVQGLLTIACKVLSGGILTVSEYAKSALRLPDAKTVVLHNAITPSLWQSAKNLRRVRSSCESVMMICSNRAYKGTMAFSTTARSLPGLGFTLVLDVRPEEIEEVRSALNAPPNLVVLPSTPDVSSLYSSHDLVLNLSDPARWIETFGLTLAEGMAFGLPAIAPNAGGPTEIVTEGVTGFLVDPTSSEEVVTRISQLVANPDLYSGMSRAALAASERFSPETFPERILAAAKPCGSLMATLFGHDKA